MKKIVSLMLAAVTMLTGSCACFASAAPAKSEQANTEEADTTVLFDKAAGKKPSIIIAPDAPATERTAASKLQKYFKDITGEDFEIAENASSGIFIGKAADFVDTSALKSEGYRIVLNGGNLGIAGKDGRGTIYGVYAFLRDFCGCRWYSRELVVTPTADKIEVPSDTDKTFNQTFEYRETDWISPTDKEFSLAHGLNGGSYRQFGEEEGGNVNYFAGLAHTLATRFCSASKYFDEKPELFALHGGERTGDQLCLSNEETYQIVLSEVMELLEKNCDKSSESLQILSLTQNDNQNYCECDKCKATDEKYGSHAGSMLLFVNRIADEVKKAGYNNIGIDTFAYQYTRKTPVGIAPRDNVIVRLCSIECCFCHTLDDENCSQNVSFMNDLREWNKICSRLYIWDYTTNYSKTNVTFSDFGVIQRNMQIFAENGAKGVYEEGAYYAAAANCEFADLRAYLLSRLLADPYIDYEAEMNEFLAAYYGDAAVYIAEYLTILRKSEEKDHMPIYDSVEELYKSLRKKDIAYIDGLWQAALAAEGNEMQKKNTARSEISWLMWEAEAKKGRFSRLQMPSVWMNNNKELFDRLVENGVTMLSEGSDNFIYDCDNTEYISASSPYFWKLSKIQNEKLVKEYTNKFRFFTFAEGKFGFILKPVFAILGKIF